MVARKPANEGKKNVIAGREHNREPDLNASYVSKLALPSKKAFFGVFFVFIPSTADVRHIVS